MEVIIAISLSNSTFEGLLLQNVQIPVNMKILKTCHVWFVSEVKLADTFVSSYSMWKKAHIKCQETNLHSIPADKPKWKNLS